MARTERYEQALRLYQSGMTLAQVGAELGVTRERIRQYLVKLGYQRRHTVTAADVVVWAYAYGTGKSLGELAQQSGIAAQVISRHLRNAGVAICRHKPGKRAKPQRYHEMRDGVMYLRCADCGDLKPETEFYATKGGWFRRHSVCKRCMIVRATAYHRAHPEKQREAVRRYEARQRAKRMSATE